MFENSLCDVSGKVFRRFALRREVLWVRAKITTWIFFVWTVAGQPATGYLYLGGLNPVAELDSENRVMSIFVCGERLQSPSYMIKVGRVYRIIADHLGSPRLVVDVKTGQVAQRMDYDIFGKVTEDSNPGFQPFGFAGGLYDRRRAVPALFPTGGLPAWLHSGWMNRTLVDPLQHTLLHRRLRTMENILRRLFSPRLTLLRFVRLQLYLCPCSSWRRQARRQP